MFDFFLSILLQFFGWFSQKFLRNINEEPSHKHYIFFDDSMIRDFYEGDFSFFSKESRNVLDIKNSVFHFGKRFFRPSVINESHDSWGDSPYKGMVPPDYKETLELVDYVAAIEKHDRNITGRIVQEKEELGEKLCLKDFVRHHAYKFECWGGIEDIYTFRQMILVVLAVENKTTRPVKLRSIKGVAYEPSQGLDFRDFDDKYGIPSEYGHPMKRLEPGEVLLIPEFFMLAPLGWDPNDEVGYKENEAWGNREIMYNEGVIDATLLPEFKIIGPSFQPQYLSLRHSPLPKDSLSARKLDLTKLHAIGKHVFCGSCPYVFGLNEQGVTYLGDILTFGYNEIDISEYDAIEIHELEEETTYIETLHLDDDLKFSEVIMKRGDHLRIENPARAYRLLRVKGHYVAAFDGYSTEIIAHKHRLIQNQMERMRSEASVYWLSEEEYEGVKVE